MLAFVANTTATWESYMNTIDGREKDHGQDLLIVAESATSARLAAERVGLADSSRAERTCGTTVDFRSQFVTVLLRALSAWTV
ncbi:MAG: hypothetical protein ACRELF_04610 [Gemmataceae bacterium]